MFDFEKVINEKNGKREQTALENADFDLPYSDNDYTVTLENADDIQYLANAVIMLENASSEELEEMIGTESAIAELIGMDIANEKTIVSLGREARKSQLIKTYAFALAREKNDPDFRKLEKVWKQDKKLEHRIMQRYSSQATRMANENLRKNFRQKGKRFVKVNNQASTKLGSTRETGGFSKKQMEANMRRAAK